MPNLDSAESLSFTEMNSKYEINGVLVETFLSHDGFPCVKFHGDLPQVVIRMQYVQGQYVLSVRPDR